MNYFLLGAVLQAHGKSQFLPTLFLSLTLDGPGDCPEGCVFKCELNGGIKFVDMRLVCSTHISKSNWFRKILPYENNKVTLFSYYYNITSTILQI